MKNKSKKADKKRLSPEKLEKNTEKRVPIATATSPTVTAKTNEIVTCVTSEALPIEVLPEEPRAIAPKISSEERRRLISMAAYYRAQRSGFGKTNPVEDWLLAEREVDAMIGGEYFP